MKKDTSWGKVATWYDTVVNDDDSYQNKVILPNMMRIVAPHKGLRVLDLACGQGFFSRAFAGAGARVTGIDIAPELIDLAQSRAGHNEEYIVSSADNLSSCKDSEFDVVTMVLALQNVEAMAKALREAGRVTKEGGKFVIVLNHPAFRIPDKTSWGFDEEKKVQYRRVDEYLSESRKAIDMNPKNPGKEMTQSFHRPLQNYSKSLANAGFAILRIEEWVSHKKSEQGIRQMAEDKSRKEIPLFMCLECIKLGGQAVVQK
jgi:ubiquinone/menaquinone biosynthesis C-methylase UbiE